MLKCFEIIFLGIGEIEELFLDIGGMVGFFFYLEEDIEEVRLLFIFFSIVSFFSYVDRG